MTSHLNRLAMVFGAAFLAIALATGYWSVIRGDALFARADNPRRVLAERRVARGTIYDRSGAVLADDTGDPGALVRHYPYPDLAPVLGYVSPLFGSAGVEAALDAVLHGDAGLDPVSVYWRTTVLGAPPPGRAIKLSIDLSLQSATDAALGDHVGAVVLLDARTGEILAMASHPTYDANQLEANWQALVGNTSSPLLNRATLALYQPGGVLWPVVLAGTVQVGLSDLSQSYPVAQQAITVDGQTIVCRAAPPVQALTLADTLSLGCPGPIAALGQRLGASALAALFDQFQLYTAPAVEIPTTAAPAGKAIADPAIYAIGQGALNLTPLRAALVMAAIARHGRMPSARLVVATQDPSGQWQTTAPAASAVQVASPLAADAVKALMPDGLTATALTSTAGKTLAWYLGFAPSVDPNYVVAVLLEDGDLAAANAIGTAALAGTAGR
jgi:peptidoglycan glycosyltransferase